MRTRRLGQNGPDLTVIGLGTWAIGGSWEYGWGAQDDRDSLEAIFEAMDCGINWIDTAPIYGCGHSEEVVGKALKQMQKKPLIATKCGLLWNEKREKIHCLDRESIFRECEASLRRLGIETIDLYQLHWPVPDAQLEDAWEAMCKLAEQGKVRQVGICNGSVELLERISSIRPPASLQNPYSMVERGIEDSLLDYCGQQQIGVLAYSPMYKGLLTGKFSHAYMQQLPADDHRKRFDRHFQEPQFSRYVKRADRLQEIAAEHNRPAAQLAIAWVLRRETVTSAIVGARRTGQITETAGASEWILDAEIMESIDRAWDSV